MAVTMNLSAINHQATKEFRYPTGENSLSFKLVTARQDALECNIICWPRYKDKQTEQLKIKLTCRYRDQFHDYYYADIRLEYIAGYIKYYFELVLKEQVVWYNAYGPCITEPVSDYYEFLWPNKNDGYQPPSWAASQIYYQIFPERYKNGDTSNDPPDTLAWGSIPTRDNTMGGDLRGIIEQLDYIESLGATCLYLNPIFTATSNHKYDTTDYFEIDPAFGTKADLKDLADRCHERGMRIILDGVFNHCGFYFSQFQDVLKNGIHSAYKDWFFVKSFPIQTDPPNYHCVGMFKWMPKLNLSNPAVRDYFLNVGLYWVEQTGIDGWRLDVADEVEGAFWQQFRLRLKQFNPELILIGETWGDAGKLLMGDQMDSAMNYLFKDVVTDWLAESKINVQKFDARINYMLSRYSAETLHVLYNPLDSHDTARFLYKCDGDKRRFMLAVGFMLTFIGAPAIYYGDEVGLTGDNDPLCRACMNWQPEGQDKELLSWYKRLIELRKNNKAFIDGGFTCNLCDSRGETYGFVRRAGNECAYVIINASDEEQACEIPTLQSEGTLAEFLTNEVVTIVAPVTTQQFYNYDIIDYAGLFSTRMPAYSIKIFIK